MGSATRNDNRHGPSDACFGWPGIGSMSRYLYCVSRLVATLIASPRKAREVLVPQRSGSSCNERRSTERPGRIDLMLCSRPVDMSRMQLIQRGSVTDRLLRMSMLAGALLALLAASVLWSFAWRPAVLISLSLCAAILFGNRRGGFLDVGPWRRGHEGETDVSNVLQRLQAMSFVVVNDVEIGAGNVDHVVIGPTGVFALETKNWSGRVWSEDGRLYRDGHDRSDAIRQAVHGAASIKDRLGCRWVEALLVFPSANVQGDRVDLRWVAGLPIARLVSFITDRPTQLGDKEIARLADLLVGSDSRSGSRGRRLLVATFAAALLVIGLLHLRSADPCGRTLDWSRAASCLGRTVSVDGPVISVRGTSDGVWLNIGNDFGMTPRLSVLVKNASSDELPTAGSRVRVNGSVDLQSDGSTPMMVVSGGEVHELGE
jgi:hypothetical protein